MSAGRPAETVTSAELSSRHDHVAEPARTPDSCFRKRLSRVRAAGSVDRYSCDPNASTRLADSWRRRRCRPRAGTTNRAAAHEVVNRGTGARRRDRILRSTRCKRPAQYSVAHIDLAVRAERQPFAADMFDKTAVMGREVGT